MGNINKTFPISSEVESLSEVLDRKYAIPAYQRPYEWNEENIKSFCDSIIEGYLSKKQVFFGTIQIANNRLKNQVWDIVDGQQRLTTFIIMLNILENKTKDMPFNGHYLGVIENSPVKELFSENAPRITDKYIENKKYIISEISNYEENIKDTEDFMSFIKDYVYFVVLTTENLPLSEVVSVFNTINTTGLDLNASDVFKFRYYDYLSSIEKNKNTEWMEEINNCYKLIEDNNEKYKKFDKIEMSWILDVYKHIICIECGFGYSELSKSNLKFYDDLFSDKKYENNLNEIEEVLSYDKFLFLVKEFIEQYRWIEEKQRNGEYSNLTVEILSTNMIGKTRYGGRYWTIPYLAGFYLIKDKVIDNRESVYMESLRVTLAFTKYFIIYSVLYAKVINDVQNRMCKEFLPMLKEAKANDLCSYLKKQMWYQYETEKRDDMDLWEKRLFEACIRKNLFDNGTRAHLICTLSDLIDEVEARKSISDIRSILFDWKNSPYDIEHIYAKNRFDEETSTELMNGIGNLVVLERSINREIKDKKVSIKKGKYRESKYQAVKNLCDSKALDEWDEAAVERRCDEQWDKISTFMNS